MAKLGRTLFRLTGAVLLGASATSIDNPRILSAPGASSRIATVQVVVAAKDMPEGVTIDRTALVVAQWPAGTQPPGAFSSVDSVASRVTRVPVYKGEAIVPGRLAPEGTRSGLEVKISPGKRAYGIRVNDATGLAGLVQPNSRVDIIVVIDDPAQGRRVAKLFMENMRVLAFGPAGEPAGEGRSLSAAVASIEVTPAEAERLAIAAARGSLQLVLRGYGNPDSVNTRGAVPNDNLLYFRRSPAVAVSAVEQSRPATPAAESPLCGVHARPGVIVRYLLLIDCGDQPRVRIATPPPKPVRPDSFALKVFRGPGNVEGGQFVKDSAMVGEQLRKSP